MRPDPSTPRTADDLARIEEVLAHFEVIEQQFERVREGLTHSHRLATLGTLAAIIAHEYNNILTPVVSYAQLALASPDDPKLMRKAVEKALAGAERAAHISSSMLGFSRDHDDAQVAPLRPTIDEAVACLGRDPAKDGIELVIDVPDVWLAMAPLNLQQVLLNLLLNARKALRRTGGRITLTATPTGSVTGGPAPGSGGGPSPQPSPWKGEGVSARAVDEVGYLTLHVADTGPGIPPEVAGRLFEPFVTQPHTPGPSEPKGTGLGLCICRDLVREAGGQITADSAPGQGATFHITLPLAPAPAPAESAATAA